MKSAKHVQHVGGINNSFGSAFGTSRGLCSYGLELAVSVEIDMIILQWTEGNWLLGDQQGAGVMVISRLFCKGRVISLQTERSVASREELHVTKLVTEASFLYPHVFIKECLEFVISMAVIMQCSLSVMTPCSLVACH
jgi:hypothetical protein